MTRVKICGLRTVEDVHKLAGELPDYAGFVFAEGSRRRVSIGEAARMKQVLPRGIEAVGVFVDQEISMIVDLVEKHIIDLVQLHGCESRGYIRKLKGLVDCPVIKSVSVDGAAMTAFPAEADHLLLDTASPQHGGTGMTFDWSLAEGMKQPFFLAGGLNEANVVEAISRLRPYCVDVSSGVETNGMKDEGKICRFIRLVRKEG